MTEIGKIAAVALIAAVCAATIQKQTPEIALLLSLCAGILILLRCAQAVEQILGVVRKTAELGGISQGLLEPVMKASGIALLTQITADVCRDGRQSGLAGAVETAGTILALAAALPLVTTLLTLLGDLLQEAA